MTRERNHKWIRASRKELVGARVGVEETGVQYVGDEKCLDEKVVVETACWVGRLARGRRVERVATCPRFRVCAVKL